MSSETKQKETHFLDGLSEIAAAPANPNIVRRKKKRDREPPESDAKVRGLVRSSLLRLPKAKRQRRAPVASAKPKAAKTGAKRSAVGSRKDAETQELYAALVAYGKNNTLNEYLNEMKFNLDPGRLRKMTKAKLREELEDVESNLANYGEAHLFNSSLKQGMTWMERVVHNRTKLKIAGTTDDCFENKEWVFQLERLKMKYRIGIGGTRHPAIELALITAYTAHIRNAGFLNPVPQTQLDVEVELPED